MTDFKEKFREQFSGFTADKVEHIPSWLQDEILAFMEEEQELTQIEWHRYGFEGGVEEERARIVELIESMKKDVAPCNCITCPAKYHVLDALLSQVQEKPFKDLGDFVAAPPEKKRKVMLEVAREANNDQRAQIGLPPLQEETECCEMCRTKETLAFPHNCSWLGNCPCHKPRTEETVCAFGCKKGHCTGELVDEMVKIGLGEETEKEGASFSGRGQSETNDVLCALAKMWNQYCGKNGHLFMSAGEHTSEILMRHGLLSDEWAEVDWDKIDALEGFSPKETPTPLPEMKVCGLLTETAHKREFCQKVNCKEHSTTPQSREQGGGNN